jgi:hypothetical protein
MAKVVTLNSIDPITFEYQDYSTQDNNLIVNFTIEPTFNPLQNYVAYFVYDLNNDVLFSNEIDFRGYSIINGQVFLNPEGDVEGAGFDEGEYNVVYNFLNNELSSSFSQKLYIDQISPDRTEIRLNTTQISNVDLINGATSLISQIQSNPGVYFDFFLNFGDNQLVIANNMLLDTSNSEDPTVLVKLYEPLPINFTLKDECWVVTEVANTVAYNINITQIFELADENIYLKGPNLNLNVKDQINNSTAYIDYSTLSSSSYATGSNNLQYQINSILAERGVEINVDYSDYNNFIYFSSAETRLENFYYKLQLIEEYTYSASYSNNSPNSYSATSSNIWQAKINEIITTFDGYDYFLYYNSGSGAWPKTNSTYPYTNASTANPGVGYNFFVTQSAIAIEFDENNNNALINAIPSYLREDEANAQYELFIEMLGEMFDNIWIYYQDVTNKFNADNRLNYGVSKDLVADILRDLGLKIYQNGFSSTDLYQAFLGVTPDGNTFPFPYITGSYPTPSGYEYIDTKISASNEIIPLQDVEYSTYKRLYHNLPFLLKKKGTTTGLQNLVTVYGIPSTILRVAEFGGKDKDESNDWDYYKQRYNYALGTGNNPSVFTDWNLNGSWNSTDDVPNTLQFRFKLPSSGSSGAVNYAVANPDVVLWSLGDNPNVAVVLEYTGSGFTSGPYSGSSVNPYYQYANLKFTADGMTSSTSVYLPFFNGDWWSVMVSRTGSDYFTLYAANNIYNGDDGSTIGFFAESSYTDLGSGVNWAQPGVNSYFGANGDSIILGGTSYSTVSGSYQEIRYYTVGLSSSAFIDWTMNPDSIEGNFLNSSPDQLAFRASLGGELFTGSVSIHPKVTGSWITTSSFASDSNFTLGSGITFIPNVETIYLDQPAAGIKNIVSNKIQIVDMNLPSGNTLSQYRSIQQQGTGSYTENLAYTEIAFSPQNEINDDIMGQLGFFNMGEFIGDPRQRFNQDTSYPNLDALRNAYFEKYVNNYDLNDYIRLIKFFDNSLFKMIKDFTPARSSLASGVVVKQTLLERNKYPQPEVTQSIYDYSGSIDIAFISGGAGGSVNNLNGLNTNPYYVDNVYGVTQSWEETFVIPSGVVTQTHDSQDEFYNGEFRGSNFIVEDGELNTECDPYKKVDTIIISYDIVHYTNNQFGEGDGGSGAEQVPISTFLAFTPPSGRINLWWNSSRIYDRESSPVAILDTYQVEYITIRKISDNNIDLTDYIPNATKLLIPAISLNPTLSATTGWSFGTYVSLTNNNENFIELDILNIGEQSNYYVLEVKQSEGYEFTITSQGTGPFGDASTPFPINISSDLNTGIILEPYVPAGFYNSDCNPLINNATFNRLSQWYQQVDYNTNQNTPVNFQQIISGSAYPAAIQDSNYTSYQYSGIRYWGSKNTTDNFNSPLTSQSQVVQTYQNDDLGITTLGYPSVNSFDTGIYEFAWGGGTYPEIAGGGAVKLSQILNVDSTSSVGIISPLTDYFAENVAQDILVNSLPQFTQYTTTANIPNSARVMTTDFGIPSISSYMIHSGSNFSANVFAFNNNIIITSASIVSTNSSGQYVTGSGTDREDITNNISSSLADGGKWFITLYRNLPTPVIGNLIPINTGYSASLPPESGSGFVDPITVNGVYEITGSNPATGFIHVKPAPKTGLTVGQTGGMLIWKAVTDGTFVLFNGATLSGVGKGNLITNTASPTIKNNLTYITQTYGTNPKNQ